MVIKREGEILKKKRGDWRWRGGGGILQRNGEEEGKKKKRKRVFIIFN